MKIKALGALCKREGAYMLRNRSYTDMNGARGIQQWLGTHGAIYLLPDLPFLTDDNVAALFDITESQRQGGKIKIGTLDFPDSMCGDDTQRGEAALDPEVITVSYLDKILRPFMTRDGLVFINHDYFKPLADVADVLTIWERYSTKGFAYFVAKVGFVVVGLFMPYMVKGELVTGLEELAIKARAAFDLEKSRLERQETNGQLDLGEAENLAE